MLQTISKGSTRELKWAKAWSIFRMKRQMSQHANYKNDNPRQCLQTNRSCNLWNTDGQLHTFSTKSLKVTSVSLNCWLRLGYSRHLTRVIYYFRFQIFSMSTKNFKSYSGSSTIYPWQTTFCIWSRLNQTDHLTKTGFCLANSGLKWLFRSVRMN